MLEMALLIDGDNASPIHLKAILKICDRYGHSSLRRVYGDWSKSNLDGWKAYLLSAGLQPVQQFACTTGKNATDIAMVIDAMDLLATGRFDGFCLVSSDSDFTPLAIRLRQQGVAVLGFGENKTPASFQKACTIFNSLALSEKPAPLSVSPALKTQALTVKPTHVKQELEPLLRKAFNRAATADGWISLGTLGQKLREIKTDFRPNDYGSAELNKLLKQADYVELDGNAHNIRARLKA